jgi:predicted dehydrogenase
MVNLGMVGCAHCHTPWIAGVLKARTDARVKAVFDHDVPRAQSIAKVLECPVVSDAAEIWDDPSINGVFVLSETDRHLSMVKSAVTAHKPVFIEKPLGIGRADAAAAGKLLHDASLLFMMGYRTRSEGTFRYLREEIQKGHFGKVTRIRYVNAHGGALKGGFGPDHQWSYDPAQAGGGVFLDLGTHALDTIMWLMGEEVVSATSAATDLMPLPGKKACEDFGEGLIRFKSGAIGSLAGAWVDVDQPVRCVISGTEGHAYVAQGKLYYKSSHVKGADGREPWIDLLADRPMVFDIFVNALAGKSEETFITPLEAARVCAVQEALAIGAREGRWVKPEWITW